MNMHCKIFHLFFVAIYIVKIMNFFLRYFCFINDGTKTYYQLKVVYIYGCTNSAGIAIMRRQKLRAKY